MNWLLLISSLIGISFSGAFIGTDQKSTADTACKAERLSIEDSPIRTMSYFSENGSGFLVVTLRNNKEQKHIYRGVDKKLWEQMKESPLPVFQASVAHRQRSSLTLPRY